MLCVSQFHAMLLNCHDLRELPLKMHCRYDQFCLGSSKGAELPNLQNCGKVGSHTNLARSQVQEVGKYLLFHVHPDPAEAGATICRCVAQPVAGQQSSEELDKRPDPVSGGRKKLSPSVSPLKASATVSSTSSKRKAQLHQ